jgi:uncharacterized protein YndB with AHSA1/START domain
MCKLSCDNARDFTIIRDFDAPSEIVFAAWTEPAQIAGWLGSGGLRALDATVSLDPRPGGAWRACLAREDGTEELLDGHYLVVEPPSNLVFGLQSSADPVTESVVTVELSPLPGGRTRMVFRQTCRNAGSFGASSAEKRPEGLVSRTRR